MSRLRISRESRDTIYRNASWGQKLSDETFDDLKTRTVHKQSQFPPTANHTRDIIEIETVSIEPQHHQQHVLGRVGGLLPGPAVGPGRDVVHRGPGLHQVLPREHPHGRARRRPAAVFRAVPGFLQGF